MLPETNDRTKQTQATNFTATKQSNLVYVSMEKANKRRSSSRTNGAVTWAQAFRDIIIAAINRGQLPLLGIIGIAALIIWRMPDTEVAGLARDLLVALKHGEGFAYVVEVATLLGWYAHSKFMRREFSQEFRRIGKEKSDIQSRAAGTKFKSSDRT